MTFDDPDVQAVFAEYAARHEADGVKARELGAEMFARRDEFLLPVGEEAAWLLHALIVARAPKRICELGTSYGYSTLFLADAARQVGAEVVTMDLADYKQAHARTQLERAGLADNVDFRCGDAIELLAQDDGPWDFVLLDIWKDLYVPCFEAVYPRLSEEAVVCTDNMISPEAARPNARELRAAIAAKGDLQTALLPVGQGIELTVKWSAGNASL
ncbi:methyltransferase domain-containing protein [Altererythrobacter salegens]|uniref:Methyltransferase domain-containing protein n=1 Tax=Croceibacterium salegens TaxID=1737568 RepID=A0A6I4ST57_9SPHN|nr:class I SAM-dependent methyltransferase [Croceibacterium salegens]MXO59093.1 methyltransferase domain-containing protein [Croceibacterium salegens]